jgi:hypothetical protein
MMVESLLINGFIFFPNEPRIDIAWSSTIWNITGHIAETTGLLAGWTLLRHCLSTKRVTTI